MTRRAVSRTDAQLVTALEARGIEVNARQIERYRQAKLLLRHKVVHPGRGMGTISYAPEGAVERVIEVRAILDGRRNLRDALFVLFMRGREVDEDALKVAYRSFFSDVVSYFRKLALRDRRAPKNPSSLDIAEAVGRRWARWARRSDLANDIRKRIAQVAGKETVDALAATVATQFVYAFLEGDLTLSVDDRMTPAHVAMHLELDAASGMNGLAKDTILGHGPMTPDVPVDAFGKELAAINRRAIRQAIDEASLVDFEAARDEFIFLIGLLSDLSKVADSAESRSDVAGLRSARAVPKDEAMLAKAVPVWMVIKNRLVADGIEVAPLYDPSTPEGQHHAKLFSTLAQIVNTASLPLRPENMARIVAEAPDEVRRAVHDFPEEDKGESTTPQ